MGRKQLPINIELLRKTVVDLEAAGPLANQSVLFGEIAKRMPEGYAPHVYRCRLVSEHIPFITPKGKRGREKGASPLGDIKAAPKRSKLRPDVKALLLRIVPVAYRGLVGRAEHSNKALLALKCLECVDWQREEVRHCQCFDCPLHSIRPYRLQSEKTSLTNTAGAV